MAVRFKPRSNARLLLAIGVASASILLPGLSSGDDSAFSTAQRLPAAEVLNRIDTQDAERIERHARLRNRLASLDPDEFSEALSELASLDEPGVTSLWEEALRHPVPELNRKAWKDHHQIRNALAQKEWVPKVVRFSLAAEELRGILSGAGIDATVWWEGGGETVAAVPTYSLQRLSAAGVDGTVIYESISNWQSALNSGDAAARLIVPDYQKESAQSQVRIAVIDVRRGSAPQAGYSPWFGDRENVLIENDSFIAYLDIFTSEDSTDAIAAHVREKYERRGRRLAGFFTADEFAVTVSRFFPGKRFDAARRKVTTAQIRPALAEGGFHSYQETLDEFNALAQANPNLARVVNLGPTHEGRQIVALKITRDPGVDDSSKADVLITGCHHAREWISVEPPVHFARQLVTRYVVDDSVRYLVDRLTIWIVPIVNPDGLTYSQGAPNDAFDSIRLWRKNRRPVSVPGCSSGVGIDLNRNYNFKWRVAGDQPCPEYRDDYGGSDNLVDEVYRGPAPDSELEVKALNGLTGDPNRNFVARLDYHNFSELILFPWGFEASFTPDHGTLSQLARRMSELIFLSGSHTYKPQQSIHLYATTGVAIDYAYAVNRIAVPITVELRPFCCEFAIPESEIGPVNEENWAAARMILNWVAGPPILQSVKAFQTSPSGTLGKLVYSARWVETEGGRRLDLETRFPRIEPGRLQVQLQFSKPMDVNLIPTATVGRTPPFNQLRFDPVGESNGWRKTIFDADTWIGETTISETPDDSAEWRLSVDASDATPLGLDAIPTTFAQYAIGTGGWAGYEDADGAGFSGGADRNHVLPATIKPGELIVLVGAPKSGERLAAGDPYTVAWTTPRDGGFSPFQQEVWLSVDGGFFYSPIATAIAGSADTHTVVIPKVATTRALIRVFARGSFTIFGDGPGTFTIGENVGSGFDVTFLSSELQEQAWSDSTILIPGGALGGPLRLAITLKLTNRSSAPIAEPFIRNADISRSNVLLSRDSNSPGLIGARQSIDAGGDGLLNPGESIDVRLLMGLVNRKKFNMSIGIYGVPSGGTVTAAEPVQIWFGRPRSR